MKKSLHEEDLVMIPASAAPLATANQGLVGSTITDSMCRRQHKNMRMVLMTVAASGTA